MISLGDGLNFSTPLAQVRGTAVPNPLFFLRSNYQPPTIDPGAWRVRIDGRVKRPLEVGLGDLQSLPTRTDEVWLECAGNSRKRFNPAGEGNQWDEQAVSDAVFKGVSLGALLEQAGLEDDALEVVATGADSTAFQRSLPLDLAFHPEVILAWEMNGEPIPAPNGGPVRLVVPGWAGVASVKWPARIEVVNEPFRGYYHAERYIIADRDGHVSGPVREMPVKSVIAWPLEGQAVAAGPNTVFGFAWSGWGEIAQVEVSTDGQRTWSPARLVPGKGPLAWRRWEFEWTPSISGAANVAVRATDTAGNVQPQTVPWNKFGYLMNAVTSRNVSVS